MNPTRRGLFATLAAGIAATVTSKPRAALPAPIPQTIVINCAPVMSPDETANALRRTLQNLEMRGLIRPR
jgi:hypothetical protein